MTDDRFEDALDDPLVTDEFGDTADDVNVVGDSEDAQSLLRRAIDTVDTARSMPLSASVLVSRDELLSILHAALERMPDEMRQARWLLKERDEFIESGRREADNLLEEVRAQAERMVQRTEIVRQANQVARRIVDDAREEARRLKHEAEDFCDQRLASFEIVLERTLKTVAAGREKLQATPPPPEGSMWRGSPRGTEDPKDGDGQEAKRGVFDQDRT